jgi:hypothetical protein
MCDQSAAPTADEETPALPREGIDSPPPTPEGEHENSFEGRSTLENLSRDALLEEAAEYRRLYYEQAAELAEIRDLKDDVRNAEAVELAAENDALGQARDHAVDRLANATTELHALYDAAGVDRVNQDLADARHEMLARVSDLPDLERRVAELEEHLSRVGDMLEMALLLGSALADRRQQ